MTRNVSKPASGAARPTPLPRLSWLRAAWGLWWVVICLTLGLWICPVFYRKPLIIDVHRVAQRDPGIWSTKVGGTSASLEKAPLFGVSLEIGPERVERRASRVAVLSRHAERHSAFFIKPGGEYLYWTMGPGKTWTPDLGVQVRVPVDMSRWLWAGSVMGMLLVILEWGSAGWRKGPRLLWVRLLTVDAGEMI